MTSQHIMDESGVVDGTTGAVPPTPNQATPKHFMTKAADGGVYEIPFASPKVMAAAQEEATRKGVSVETVLAQCACRGPAGNCPCIRRRR